MQDEKQVLMEKDYFEYGWFDGAGIIFGWASCVVGPLRNIKRITTYFLKGKIYSGIFTLMTTLLTSVLMTWYNKQQILKSIPERASRLEMAKPWIFSLLQFEPAKRFCKVFWLVRRAYRSSTSPEERAKVLRKANYEHWKALKLRIIEMTFEDFPQWILAAHELIRGEVNESLVSEIFGYFYYVELFLTVVSWLFLPFVGLTFAKFHDYKELFEESTILKCWIRWLRKFALILIAVSRVFTLAWLSSVLEGSQVFLMFFVIFVLAALSAVIHYVYWPPSPSENSVAASARDRDAEVEMLRRPQEDDGHCQAFVATACLTDTEGDADETQSEADRGRHLSDEGESQTITSSGCGSAVTSPDTEESEQEWSQESRVDFFLQRIVLCLCNVFMFYRDFPGETLATYICYYLMNGLINAIMLIVAFFHEHSEKRGIYLLVSCLAGNVIGSGIALLSVFLFLHRNFRTGNRSEQDPESGNLCLLDKDSAPDSIITSSLSVELQAHPAPACSEVSQRPEELCIPPCS